MYFVWVAMAPAHAHSWYSSTNDPAYQSNCCGGHDCAPVDPAWVSETKEGYHLVMTLEQARTVNPTAVSGIDAIIPWNRVQAPPENKDGQPFYACIYDRDRTAPRGGVICFFATPTM
jgi:hypothetical protein